MTKFLQNGVGVTPMNEAPTLFRQAVATDKIVTEPLGPLTNVYVTAKTGNPMYRWI